MLFTVRSNECEAALASYPYRIRISPDVISQEVLLGETVLLDVKTLVYFGLDELGSAVWREIQECPDADEALSRLLSSTPLQAEELRDKFFSILKGLERSRIIELEPNSA